MVEGTDSESFFADGRLSEQVHERSVDSDFLLLELRDILQRNQKIKVVLVSGCPSSNLVSTTLMLALQMSATINQAQFSDYFGGAPCIEIPG